MRRGARPCGAGSPGPGRGRSGQRAPDYKSQKPAGPVPPHPEPSLPPRTGGQGRETAGGVMPRAAGARPVKTLPPVGKALRLVWRVRTAIKTRGEAATGGSPPRADIAGENPASPPRPPSLLSGSKGTRALRSAAGEVRVPLSSAAGTHAWDRVVNHNCRSCLALPPLLFLFKSRFALGNALSHLLRNNY